MKTSTHLKTLLITLTVLLAMNLSATNNNTFNFAEEEYINDIPFSTEAIFNSLTNPPAMEVNFDFQEEKYIDDIPFNTECFAQQCLFEKAMNVEFSFKEEEYINDIPFDLK